MKKIIIYSIIFIIVGELMLRFDKSFTPLEENRIVKIPTDIELTPEYNMLVNNTFVFNEKDLRIMVIGDSYIHGGGIDFENNFSQQLKKLFEAKNYGNNKIWILDVSKSSSNSLDNNQTYFNFIDKFKPHIVILGYNLNDIEGELNKHNREYSNIESFKQIKPSGTESKSMIRKIYKIIKSSYFISYVMGKVHRTLNEHGIIFPNSKFDISMKSYYQNREAWRKSKLLFIEIINDAKDKNIQLLIYKFAEMSKYPQLYSKANETIDLFFSNFSSVIYIDGNDFFKAENAKKYRLSRHDGHPNELAHKKMAEDLFNIINH